jgi:putative transposase
VAEYEPKPLGTNAEVGIDPGRKEGMTLSTGARVGNSRMFAKHETVLACAQRSGKKRRTQAIHATITNSRKHFLHKETTKIADAFGLICVSNVSGRLQATNRKSSADASTGMSRNMLRYKAIARVATFVDTCEHLSTQTCCECGCVGGPKGLKDLEIREWSATSAALFMIATSTPRETFSVWDVRRLQKKAPSTPLSLDGEDVTCC